MNETINPGHPEPDVMAVERLRTLLARAIDRPGMDAPYYEAERPASVFRSVRFQRDVNSAGVAVRRVVAYGEWEVDPNPDKSASHIRSVCDSVPMGSDTGEREQTGVQCGNPYCESFGSTDMGEGTCPAEHAAPTFD